MFCCRTDSYCGLVQLSHVEYKPILYVCISIYKEHNPSSKLSRGQCSLVRLYRSTHTHTCSSSHSAFGGLNRRTHRRTPAPPPRNRDVASSISSTCRDDGGLVCYRNLGRRRLAFLLRDVIAQLRSTIVAVTRRQPLPPSAAAAGHRRGERQFTVSSDH